MKNGILALAGATGAFGALIVAGFLLAFSALVMRSLDRIAAGSAIEAMQAINVIAVRSLLMPAMFGTALLALVLAIAAMSGGPTPWRWQFIGGAVVYIIGTIGVTVICNVPANNSLATVTANTPDASTVWAAYSPGWTLWNHVRTIASAVAGVAFVWGAAIAWFGNEGVNS